MTAPSTLDRAAADARWERHVATLTVRPDAPLHGARSQWTARDEYAHLARWMAAAAARVHAARAGHPRPDLGGDPNLRWQAEDRALTLDDARRRAEDARAELLAAVAPLPAGTAGDGLRALAAGDLIAHLDEHFGFIVDGVLADEAERWTALLAHIDGAPGTADAPADAPAGGGERHGGIAETPAAVFAHLARWFDFAAASLAAAHAGEPLPPVPDIDAANRRWAIEDRVLSLAAARARAVEGRARVLALARQFATPDWTAAALNRLEGNTAGHYPEHLAAPIR